jgi:hypothetical protein
MSLYGDVYLRAAASRLRLVRNGAVGIVVLTPVLPVVTPCEWLMLVLSVLPLIPTELPPVWVSEPPVPPKLAAPRRTRLSGPEIRVQPDPHETVESTMAPDQSPSGEGGFVHLRLPEPSFVRSWRPASWGRRRRCR